MKRRIFIIAMIFISSTSFAQSNFDFTSSQWKLGEQKLIYGTQVKRIEGENKNENFITNIAYIDYLKLFADEIDVPKSIKQIILFEKEFKNDSKEPKKFGEIRVFIMRPTLRAAELERYKVVIRDRLGKIVFDEYFKNIDSKPTSIRGRSILTENTIELAESKYQNMGMIYLPIKLSGKHVISILYIDKVYGMDLQRFEIVF